MDSLWRYRRPRLVIQSPGTSVYTAARAMAANRVGLLIVQELGKVTGVLSDRDIALRVVGRGLDPERTTVGEVMTREPVTLPIVESERRALALMRHRHVRRIPLLENERVVGLVTLDDLILSARASPHEIAGVVRAQLSQPSEMKPGGVTHPVRPARSDAGDRRHTRRMLQSVHRAVNLIRDATGLEEFEQALVALEVVVRGIVKRLPLREASALLAQLPSELRERLLQMPTGPGPDRGLTRDAIDLELARRLDIEIPNASAVVDDVGRALRYLVGDAELAQVRELLPSELRSLVHDEIVHRVP